MLNFIPDDLIQFLRIIGVFIGLYIILIGLLISIDWPKLKKQK